MKKKKKPVKNTKKKTNTKINRGKKAKTKKKTKRSIGSIILIFLMIILISITLAVVGFMIVIISGAPTFSEDGLYSKESSIIYDLHGNELARLGTENREIVSYDDLPEVFIDAVLATEDSRFMLHSGVDLARFLKASLGQLFGNSDAGGASTLTMQIVKQKFTDDTAVGIKGIIRKFTDVYMAMFKIEKNYTKEQIIEFYVNIPYLGGGASGIEQASQSYFGKSIGEVTLTEAAILAGLFQAPDAFDPYKYPEKTESRRNQVLNLMKRHGYITDEESEIAKAISVTSLLAKDGANVNQHQGLIDTVVEEVKQRTKKDLGIEMNPYSVSMKIYSTFNLEKQDVINKINDGTSYNWPNEKLQTGIAVIDVDTGSIAAVGAGRNRKGELGYNFATMISRHPGSTAKPLFDYGPAIEYLNWGTGTTIVDDHYTYSNGITIRNWDHGYQGIITVKRALAGSRNIPSLQAFQAVPQRNIREFVTGLGLKPEIDATGFIHEAHSLGGYDGTNPLELAAAYATFSRGGIYIEPHSFTKAEFINTGEVYTVTPEKRTVMKDSTAFMINNILRYAVTGGFVPASSKSGTDVAGKTGTSTVDSKHKQQLGITGNMIGDSWQVVYSPDYTIATWVGYEENTKEYYLTNSVGTHARNSLSRTLSAGILEPNSRFKAPSSVVQATIELQTIPLQLASEFTPTDLKSTEYFRKGTSPAEVSNRFAKLSNPTNLNAEYDNNKVNLTWTPIQTPDAINPDYLTKYFQEGYGRWAEKYFNNRINYNASNIGNIGYQIYLDTGSGLRDLGWTASSSYTYAGTLSSNAKFIVKSSYSIFKDNMSDGISKTVEAKTSSNITVELLTSNCITQTDFNIIKMSGNYLSVYSDGQDVTKQATITDVCYYNNNQIDCNNMTANNEYTIKPTIVYEGRTINHVISLRLNPTCN